MAEPSESDGGWNAPPLVRAAPPFVGRKQHLEWIERSLQSALAGQPGVMLIPGEAGIGKTRLLQEVREEALRRGIQVGYGRSYEDLTLPYLPVVEASQALLAQLPPDVESALRDDLAALNQMLHLDRAGRPAADPSTPTESDQEKLQLFFAVSHAIVRLAQRTPTLFIIDDLHWADRSSIDLFGHLVFTVADAALREPIALLIVGTYRPVEAETPLAHMIARLQRETICQTLTLPGLDEAEIRDLIRGLGLRRPSHQLIATVSEATQGNPLFIQEVLHHLMQRQALQERGGYLVTTLAPADLPLPEQVTAALLARTRGLSKSCRELLTLAAFLGDRLALPLLSAVSGLSEEAVLDLLEEGRQQRLLVSEGLGFQFAHPLIRHVFYNEPSAPRRGRLHHHIAGVLEGLYAADLEAHLLEIAHHLVRAGPHADVAKVVEYSRRAGDRAFQMFAWGEAAQFYEAALAAAEAAGRLSTLERADLHYRAGLARYRDQDVGPCLAHYEEAIAAYRLAGDLAGLANVLIGKTETQYTLASVPLGALPDLQPLEEVLAALGEREPALRGRILSTMAQVYRNARQADKAVAMAQRALALGRSIGDDHLCARASSALALAHIHGLQVREALACYESALSYARRTDDLWLQGWPLQRMPLALTLLGRLEEAESVALEACALTRQTHDWGDYSVALSHLTTLAVATGDFGACEQRAYETLLMVYRSGYVWGGVRALYALACARALRGAWAEAEDALDLLIHPNHAFQDVGPVIQTFARAFRVLLRVYADTLRTAVEPFASEVMHAVSSDTYSLAPLCALVELADLTAAPPLAERAVPALLRAAPRGVQFSSGWMCLIPRVLGVAAGLKRRWGEAEAYFQEAIERASQAGARPELGRTYLDYARLLASRRRSGDRARAIELVTEAGHIFDELDMRPFTRRAVQLAGGLQARLAVPKRRRAVPPDKLNATAVGVLLQIAQGRAEQEIAETLILSRRTVARHIRGLRQRIGITGQREALTYAVGKGLLGHVPSRRGLGSAPPPRHVAGGAADRPARIILITDMVSSTSLIQRLGDRQAYAVFRLHDSVVRDCLRAHQGVEVKHTGDGIQASFSSASSAIACAVDIQKAFAQYTAEHPANPVQVRIGIHAGEPIAAEGQLFGTAIHMAFRICTRARPAQILVSDVVRQLAAGAGFVFADGGRHVLKGLPGRHHLYEVRWEEAGH
jgi:class 3 adenylate cyclase/DNA-binding CsgD family transcriptional regulator